MFYIVNLVLQKGSSIQLSLNNQCYRDSIWLNHCKLQIAGKVLRNASYSIREIQLFSVL